MSSDQLSLQTTLRETDEMHILKIIEWCRDYTRRGKYPCGIVFRFHVGFYQIHQGMLWKDKANLAESYISAALHFIMACEMAKGTNIEAAFHGHQFDLRHLEHNAIDPRGLLIDLSLAAQQIIYYDQLATQKTKRASRYSSLKLSTSIGSAVKSLFMAVPIEARRNGMIDATRNMTGVL